MTSGKQLRSVEPISRMPRVYNVRRFTWVKSPASVAIMIQRAPRATCGRHSPTLDDAAYRLEEFRDKWAKKYPQILKSWDENWTELTTYFKYPPEFRRVIYTTNAVEGFHRMLRKYTKTKTIFPTDDALRKSVYLAIAQITRKWTMPIPNWGVIMGQLMIFFEEELAAVGML